MTLKAILFDLDGTLLDTSLDLQTALHRVQDQYHLPLSSLEEVQQAMGNGIEALVKHEMKDLDSSLLPQALELFHQYYSECYNNQTQPYLGIHEYLLQLKQKGILCAVVTNKHDSYAQTLIETHFPDIFEVVCGAIEGIPKKPHPAMISMTLEKLHIKAEEAIYIGDTEVDLQSASNASIKGILVSWGYRSKEQLNRLNEVPVYDTVDDCFRALGCV